MLVLDITVISKNTTKKHYGSHDNMFSSTILTKGSSTTRKKVCAISMPVVLLKADTFCRQLIAATDLGARKAIPRACDVKGSFLDGNGRSIR